MKDYGVLIMFTNVLDEHSASIFRVEGCSEDGDTRFLQNVGNHLPDYTAS
jgi:hypothetical protein